VKYLPENEEGSFASAEELLKEKEQKAKKPQSPELGNEAPLFKYLDRIATAIESNTESVKALTESTNALTSTLVSKLRDTMVDKDAPRQLKEEIVSQKVKEETVQTPTTTPPLPKPQLQPQTTSAPSQTQNAVDEAKMLFTKELEQMLIFEDQGEYIKIKPRQYLGSENFAKIASVCREMNGEYISAGKDSHFKLPKPTQ